MKKAILITIVLFLAGCQALNLPFTSQLQQNEIPQIDVYKGKEGISIKFVPGAPPDKMVATSDINSYEVGVVIENRGAADAEGVVALILEKNFMEAAQKFLAIEGGVEGREKFTSGGIKDLKFDVNTKALSKENYETNPKPNVQAAACYKYQTKASAPICIDTSKYRGTAEKGACTESTLYFTEGQGAPVAVTKIESVILIKNSQAFPYLKIFMENAGRGEVLNRTQTTDACSDKPAVHSIIHLDSASIGGKQLSCEPKNAEETLLKLREEKENNYFTCEAAAGTQGFDAGAQSFITDLSITLSYGYETTITKQVELVVV